jgi:outer membrane lipopolysaccharide assembly protein LptE/RlpB
MKRQGLALAAAVLAAGFLAGCGEKPQTNAQGVKHDAVPWSGTGTQENTGTVFTAPDWKVGDKTAWQQQLKTRTQNGQNEYNKEN